MLSASTTTRLPANYACRGSTALPPAVCHAPAARRAVRAGARSEQGEEVPASLPQVAAPAEVPSSDPWEGEQFEMLGNIASMFIPILVAAAVGVGIFASQTYNEGATVFLDAPKSQEDTAKLIPAQQLMQP